MRSPALENVLYARRSRPPTSMSCRVTACSTRSGGLRSLAGRRRRQNWSSSPAMPSRLTKAIGPTRHTRSSVGLGRTLALEHPEIWRAIIDVDDSAPPELIAHYVRAEVGAADGEDQVVYRAGVRHVPRLERRIRQYRSPGWRRHQPPVVGATGNIGPYLIRQLAEMGAATIVAVSRHASSRLEELASSLASSGTAR